MESFNGNIDLSCSTRGAIYGRFSSDMQRLVSLEDQERDCRELIAQKEWVVAEGYVDSDAGISGTSILNRPALRRLVLAAKMRPRPFDYLVIDDTSRLTRNLGDILKLSDLLEHHQVKLYFVTQKLDSHDDNFRTMLTHHGMVDEQYVKRLAKSVHRGQKGRVLAGYTSGSRCFGYQSVRVLNPDRTSETGRDATLGVKLVTIPEEAATIVRIGEMFAGGVSVHQIQKILTIERVPAARKPRIGDTPSSWNSCLINRILRNEKYVGVILWNKTFQVRDPETGVVEVRRKRQDEIVQVQAPQLRIYSDELWARIQARIKVIDEKVKHHRLGGMNRAQNKTYLFSGLLECGVCGGAIIITGGKGCEASYGCSAARYQRGCANTLRVRANRLTAQLVEALGQQVLTPEYLQSLVVAVCRELNGQFKESRKRALAAGTELPQRKLDLERQQRCVVDAIAVMKADQLTILTDKLAAIGEQIQDVARQIWMAKTDSKQEVSLEEVRVLVTAIANDLIRVCQDNVEKAKSMMQKHIDRLILTPKDTLDGPVYTVTVAMELFPASDVVLDGGSTPTIQHYQSHKFGFAGVIIDPRLEGVNEEAPKRAGILRDLLVELLGKLPCLQGQRLTAAEWRSHIMTATAEHGYGSETVLRPKSMTRLIIHYDSMLSRSMEVDFGIDGLTGKRTYSFRLLEAKQKKTSTRRPVTIDAEMPETREAA